MAVSDPRNLLYGSPYPTDKIVRIFTGTYQAADLTTRVGTISTAYVYRIAHGLNRPVKCDLITSTDGGTTWDLGVSKIAFSDSTYVYIFHGYAATGPVAYKVFCSWIDDYDSTNPLVDIVTYSSNEILFDSRENYQKIALQGVVSGSTSGTTSISHPLTYAPNAKVYIEAFSGEVWPLNFGGVRNAFLYDGPQVEGEARIDSNSIEVTLAGGVGSPATARIWYTVYYDAD